MAAISTRQRILQVELDDGSGYAVNCLVEAGETVESFLLRFLSTFDGLYQQLRQLTESHGLANAPAHWHVTLGPACELRYLLVIDAASRIYKKKKGDENKNNHLNRERVDDRWQVRSVGAGLFEKEVGVWWSPEHRIDELMDPCLTRARVLLKLCPPHLSCFGAASSPSSSSSSANQDLARRIEIQHRPSPTIPSGFAASRPLHGPHPPSLPPPIPRGFGDGAPSSGMVSPDDDTVVAARISKNEESIGLTRAKGASRSETRKRKQAAEVNVNPPADDSDANGQATKALVQERARSTVDAPANENESLKGLAVDPTTEIVAKGVANQVQRCGRGSGEHATDNGSETEVGQVVSIVSMLVGVKHDIPPPEATDEGTAVRKDNGKPQVITGAREAVASRDTQVSAMQREDDSTDDDSSGASSRSNSSSSRSASSSSSSSSTSSSSSSSRSSRLSSSPPYSEVIPAEIAVKEGLTADPNHAEQNEVKDSAVQEQQGDSGDDDSSTSSSASSDSSSSSSTSNSSGSSSSSSSSSSLSSSSSSSSPPNSQSIPSKVFVEGDGVKGDRDGNDEDVMAVVTKAGPDVTSSASMLCVERDHPPVTMGSDGTSSKPADEQVMAQVELEPQITSGAGEASRDDHKDTAVRKQSGSSEDDTSTTSSSTSGSSSSSSTKSSSGSSSSASTSSSSSPSESSAPSSSYSQTLPIDAAMGGSQTADQSPTETDGASKSRATKSSRPATSETASSRTLPSSASSKNSHPSDSSAGRGPTNRSKDDETGLVNSTDKNGAESLDAPGGKHDSSSSSSSSRSSSSTSSSPSTASSSTSTSKMTPARQPSPKDDRKSSGDTKYDNGDDNSSESSSSSSRSTSSTSDQLSPSRVDVDAMKQSTARGTPTQNRASSRYRPPPLLSPTQPIVIGIPRANSQRNHQQHHF